MLDILFESNSKNVFFKQKHSDTERFKLEEEPRVTGNSPFFFF